MMELSSILSHGSSLSNLEFVDIEPTCFSTVVKQGVWRDATGDEFNALLKNGTWILVPPQPSMNIVGCKWVFQIKRKAVAYSAIVSSDRTLGHRILG
jgi:hypothetical protein